MTKPSPKAKRPPKRASAQKNKIDVRGHIDPPERKTKKVAAADDRAPPARAKDRADEAEPRKKAAKGPRAEAGRRDAKPSSKTASKAASKAPAKAAPKGAGKTPRTDERRDARAAEPSKRRTKREAPIELVADEGLVLRHAIEPDLGDLDGFRAGYVALVGRPNVGKSTILNQLLGQKLAATTHKPQTTRKNLLGILHPKGAQVLVLDTPGYHKAEGALNRYMVEQSRAAIAEADVIGYVIEARKDAEITPGNEQLIELLQRAEKPVVLLVNKVDELEDKTALLPLIQRYNGVLSERLTAVVPISALKKDGLAEAVRELALALPKSAPLFAEDEVTDQSERSIVAEFVREKVMLETKEELPYATAVSIDLFEDHRPRLVRILATIHVEKESQKPIVIGRGGQRLKAIGMRARKDIEHFLGAKVFLELHVRVTEAWSTSPQAMDMLGYGVER